MRIDINELALESAILELKLEEMKKQYAALEERIVAIEEVVNYMLYPLLEQEDL